MIKDSNTTISTAFFLLLPKCHYNVLNYILLLNLMIYFLIINILLKKPGTE